jgi:glucose/arabinose dehydrogenase
MSSRSARIWMSLTKRSFWSKLLLPVLILVLSACASGARPLRPADIVLPDDFVIDVAVEGLAAPTMLAFDDQNRMLIAESGYGGGGDAKVTRVEADGKKTVLASGNAFGDEVPVTSVAFYNGQVYVVHAGSVSIIQPDGTLNSIISGLPGQGDHQANSLVFHDGMMYLSIGTVTNSAVVGPDNAVYGWLEKEQNRQLHDVPCQDITLVDKVFESEDPLGESQGPVETAAYAAFGSIESAGQTVKGDVKCNGAVLRANPDGSDLSVFAWGFRNPYGMEIGPDEAIYVTMHGFDARGSRPIEDTWDCLYRVEENGWYGWPDFACEVPVTDADFKPHDQPRPEFLMASHPTDSPPQPIAKFPPHAAINGFAFAPSDDWGKNTDVFIALFGDFTPATGTVEEPQGVKVVRVDTSNGQISDFITNKVSGMASTHNAGGLEHPSDVTFSPDGSAMYITDWGVAHITVDGIKLDPNTGVVWKVTHGTRQGSLPGGPSLVFAIVGTIALAAGTAFSMRGRGGSRSLVDGLLMGAVAGVVMGVAAMIISSLILNLPWYAPPRVFATMVIGRAAVANILEFKFAPFLVGLIVVVVLTGLLGVLFAWLTHTRNPRKILVAGLLYGLTFWAVLQYLVGPLLFELVVEKGFPPHWYAVAFGLYGLVLGWLLGYVRPPHSAVPPTEQM